LLNSQQFAPFEILTYAKLKTVSEIINKKQTFSFGKLSQIFVLNFIALDFQNFIE